MSFTIFQNEKTLFQAIKTRSSKSGKINMVLVQKWPFWQLFFFSNIGQENVFNIFYSEKTPLQAKKKISAISREIDIFPNGLIHGFGPKKAIFAAFLFQAIQARKMSFTILQNEKTPFQAIKTRSSKSRKTDIFPKGLTHGFGPKMAIFGTSSLTQHRSAKCLLRYSRTKKRLSSL